jgi:hypothetical protein
MSELTYLGSALSSLWECWLHHDLTVLSALLATHALEAKRKDPISAAGART